jgi:hypothetical protein
MRTRIEICHCSSCSSSRYWGMLSCEHFVLSAWPHQGVNGGVLLTPPGL